MPISLVERVRAVERALAAASQISLVERVRAVERALAAASHRRMFCWVDRASQQPPRLERVVSHRALHAASVLLAVREAMRVLAVFIAWLNYKRLQRLFRSTFLAMQYKTFAVRKIKANNRALIRQCFYVWCNRPQPRYTLQV